ncbi:50S ribosomal protein L24 [Candidatus Legionella polyplacis]|uniref:Large ribosomal subunit protein uL24 n=1 Tax=Candidatus Legionella polyplacis TaxID=2005262 RepID=A0ABZ2GZC0_9GAMM
MRRIKLNDIVMVLSGKNKGSIGKIKRVVGDKVIVDGVNLCRKAIKPNPKIGQEGGLIFKEMPIHISNVGLYNNDFEKYDKIGFKYLKVDKCNFRYKVRYFKSNKKVIDNFSTKNRYLKKIKNV